MGGILSIRVNLSIISIFLLCLVKAIVAYIERNIVRNHGIITSSSILWKWSHRVNIIDWVETFVFPFLIKDIVFHWGNLTPKTFLAHWTIPIWIERAIILRKHKRVRKLLQEISRKEKRKYFQIFHIINETFKRIIL